METLIGGVIIFYLVMFAVSIAAFVFWLRMLIAAVKNNYENKPLWILAVIFFNIVGAFVFYFTEYEKIKAGRK